MENINKVIASLCEEPEFSPNDINRLMRDYGMKERAFALLMNVSVTTVRLWLNGIAKPNPTARRLMQVYNEMPEVLTRLAEIWQEQESRENN